MKKGWAGREVPDEELHSTVEIDVGATYLKLSGMNTTSAVNHATHRRCHCVQLNLCLTRTVGGAKVVQALPLPPAAAKAGSHLMA